MGNIFLATLEISISISFIVIGLIFLTPFLNKRYAAKWKYLIWIFLAIWLLFPFSGANGQYVMDRMSQLKVAANSESERNDANNPTGLAIPYQGIVVEIPAQMTAPIKAPSEKNTTGITMLDIVALVWIIGSFIFMTVHLISYFQYKWQVRKNGQRVREACILSPMFQLKCELHIRRTVSVMEYDGAESPMIIGFIKPVLVLPKEQYSSEDLFFILKHELIHLKRGDVYLKLLFVTANAVHWFNPFIWIMQKEAAIDMELSCDERVTRGTSYAMRKAYTETLLSMLHKQCVKKTALSTQFYGGTAIMKKRFKNILIRSSKKNGIFILVCVIILTISLGTLVGCSAAKEDIKKADTANEVMGNVPEPSTREAARTEPAPADRPSADNNALENTITLSFSKEGEQEQKQTTLAIGNGYSLYLPSDEKWHLSAPDLWVSDINEQLALWITHFEGETVDSVNQKLEGDGYVEEDSHRWWKQEGDRIYHVEQKVFENNIWGIFCSYPVEYEEGWGREFPVIANTFTLLNGADYAATNPTAEAGESLGTEDCQKIRAALGNFAEAYFDGDVDAVQKFLASTYEGDVEIYEGTGMISDLTVKGLSDTDEKKIENGTCTVSIEFRDSNYEDIFLYLTCILVKEQSEWKIQFYGIEG